MFLLQHTQLLNRPGCLIGEDLLYLYNRYFQHQQTYGREVRDWVISRSRQQLDQDKVHLVVEGEADLTVWSLLPAHYVPPASSQNRSTKSHPPRSSLVLKLLQDYHQGQRNFHNMALEGSDLSQVDLPRIDLSYGLLNESCLRRANLTQGSLAWAYLRQADLQEANLRETHLEGAYLNWADLSQADLSRSCLVQAELTEACLRQSLLSQANLQGAVLLNADLRGANLRYADLSQANLAGADLSQADLTGAQVSLSSLRRSQLHETILPTGKPVSGPLSL